MKRSSAGNKLFAIQSIPLLILSTKEIFSIAIKDDYHIFAIN